MLHLKNWKCIWNLIFKELCDHYQLTMKIKLSEKFAQKSCKQKFPDIYIYIFNTFVVAELYACSILYINSLHTE